MSLSEFLSLTFIASIEYEEALKGYFLINHDVQGFEESSTGLLTVYLLRSEWDLPQQSSLKEFLTTVPEKEVRLVDSEEIEEKDWNAAWEAEIQPVKISSELVISPSWKIDEARLIGTKHLLIIDPKMSFGTGHHETTRLCLKAIEDIDCLDRTVLDIGTGTGALAMYALLRGGRYAVGIDTDEWSYKNVIENRERNSLPESKFDVRHGDLSQRVKHDELFDIILANIHRNILLAIAKDMAAHQQIDCRLILSGILEYDTKEVVTAYEEAGYSLNLIMQENEWIALDLHLSRK